MKFFFAIRSLFYMQLSLSNVTSRVFLSFFSVATAVGETMSLFECSSPILLFDERLCLCCVGLFSRMYGKALRRVK